MVMGGKEMEDTEIRHLIVKIIQLAEPMRYSDGSIMGYHFPMLSLGVEDLDKLKELVKA